MEMAVYCDVADCPISWPTGMAPANPICITGIWVSGDHALIKLEQFLTLLDPVFL
jgi:hypothetical protein